MEKEYQQKIEQMARLLLTPQQIADILGLDFEAASRLSSQYSEEGRTYRRVVAEKAMELHEKTMALANVGSPTAMEEANAYLRSVMVALS